jgi:hypothetical protein
MSDTKRGATSALPRWVDVAQHGEFAAVALERLGYAARFGDRRFVAPVAAPPTSKNLTRKAAKRHVA